MISVPHMFVHRGHTGEGVIITVLADKLGLCLVCRRLQVQISARHVCLFFFKQKTAYEIA